MPGGALNNLKKLLEIDGDEVGAVDIILKAWDEIIDLADNPIDAMFDNTIRDYERNLIAALNEIQASQAIIASMQRSIDKKKELYAAAEKKIIEVVATAATLEDNEELNSALDQVLVDLNKDLHDIPVLQDVNLEE